MVQTQELGKDIFPNFLHDRKAKMTIENKIPTCDKIFASSPPRPDSRDPTIYLELLVSRFKTKAIWLFKRTSRNAK